MLVLARKKSEMIQIGEDIVIKVIHAGKNTVKIGIEAPARVRVLRAELCEPVGPSHSLAAFMKERAALRKGAHAAPKAASVARPTLD